MEQRPSLLPFTRDPGEQSDDLFLDGVLCKPEGFLPVAASNQHDGSMSVTGASTARSVASSTARSGRSKSVREVPPVEPGKTPLCLLPVSDVVEQYYGLAAKGMSQNNPYKRNQDCVVTEVDEGTDSLLMATLDGHGMHGDRVSSWVARELPLRLFGHGLWSQHPLAALEGVVGDLAALLRDPAAAARLFMDTEFSGTTATVVVLRGATLYVAHLGDCRAVLVHSKRQPQAAMPMPGFGTQGSTRSSTRGSTRGSTRSGTRGRGGYGGGYGEGGGWASGGDDGGGGGVVATDLTVEHRPSDEGERQRIKEAGGRVFAVRYDDGQVAPERLWLPTLDLPGLAVSRALGDAIGAEFAGVSATPDFFTVDLEGPEQRLKGGRGDWLLILATDGLWDALSSQDAAEVCASVLQGTEGKATVAIGRGGQSGDAVTMADALVLEAQERWHTEQGRSDDIGVIVALFSGYKGTFEGPGGFDPTWG